MWTTESDRALGWGFSIALHVVFLVGATLAASEHFVILAGPGGTDLACSVRTSMPIIDRIEWPPDFMGSTRPVLDPLVPPDELEGRSDFGSEVVTIYFEEGTLWCGNAIAEISREHHGRVRFVAVPRQQHSMQIARFAQRMQSLANNRAKSPRLKVPARCNCNSGVGPIPDEQCPQCSAFPSRQNRH